ncbi:MAG: metallophosphoesterase [Treponema sp.]|jgi:predicted phosphodiesterase|nr:metallophosphoesterase [Treponema sp.]
MVKSTLKILLPILRICAVFSFAVCGCKVDIFGLFASTDLDERLKEKNNFKFLTGSGLSPSFGEEYSFIVITDIHIEDGDAYGLEKIKNVTEENSEIQFAVFCGDITQYGSEQDIKLFIEIARSLNIPCYPVIGNHDIFFGNWTVWKELIGSTSYRVNGDSSSLFILDSANGFLGKGQIDWLENELKSAKGRIFVFSHYNFFVGAPNPQQFADTRERARIISLLSGKCDIMFLGHSHERLIREAGGVRYINIDDFTGSKTYCLVSVKKTGISYEFKKL